MSIKNGKLYSYFGFLRPEIDMIRRQLKSKIMSKNINERIILTGREEEGFLPFVFMDFLKFQPFINFLKPEFRI